MAKGTKIQWCDDTVNGEMGCDGCELWAPERGVFHCFAGNDTGRKAGRPGFPASFAEPTLFLERIPAACRWQDLRGTSRPKKPWLDGYPRLIFFNDYGDTFTESLPLGWFDEHVPMMAASPHVWIILTKRPQRLLQWVRQARRPLPLNFWLCVSLTDAASLGRVRHVLEARRELPRHVVGLSVEPLRADLAPLLRRDWPALPGAVSWVKVGGESKQPHAPAHPCALEWVRGLLDFFRGRAAVFVKQLGSHPTLGASRLRFKDGHGGDWREWPEDLRVREMPLPPLTAACA
jgi:protein gp37